MRKRVPVPQSLISLLEAPGPSGHEDEATRVWREAAGRFAEISSDTLGTTFARVGSAGGGAARPLALVGHIDQIGVAITDIEDSGLLAVTTIGGITPEMLLGQRLRFLTRDGEVVGTIARRRLSPEQARDRPRIEHSDLHVDIGARDRAEAEALVRVGDAAVWAGPTIELPSGRLLSQALDNRLGAYVVLEAAKRIAEAGGAGIDVVAVAAVQEEIGLFGARTSAYGLDPLAAIVVDVTPATDTPGGEARLAGRIELGQGVMIGRGPTLNRKLTDLLSDVAAAAEIPHAFEVYSRMTSTDADEVHRSRSGVPTSLLSIPTRYIHSPGELCDLADVESAVRLIVAVAGHLDGETSFLR
ncbi:MAG TPA: M20/M25/M40 family metallo-hydrolase [Gaiellaceae bacterium]|nr:M20/M25/M40 family metallo-hydrolase [Gaiellaceae bacterium]